MDTTISKGDINLETERLSKPYMNQRYIVQNATVYQIN